MQAAGATKAGAIIDAAEKTAHISVDGRYGKWSAPRVLPPPSPAATDLLNRSVDGTSTGTSTTTGQSS